MNTIGDRLKYARSLRNLTQKDLAKAMGATSAAVSALETGTTKSPTPENLFPLARCLDVSAEWLITGRGEMSGGRDIVRVAGNETEQGYIRLPQIDLPAGAGPGAEVDAEPAVVRFVDVTDQWAADNFGKRVSNIRVMTAKGDSMVGAGINSGDLLFVDTSQHVWDGDGFYIVQFLNGWQVKRLRADIMSQQLEIVSMPVTGAESYAVPSDRIDELRIGGKVAAWWTLRHH